MNEILVPLPRPRGGFHAALALTVATLAPAGLRAQPAGTAAYRDVATRIIGAARADHFAWNRLGELTDTFGPRLSGSAALARALQWAVSEMKKDGLENVRLEKVMVPAWVRGRESAELVSPAPAPLVMLGLGGSVGTGLQGIEAEVLVVSSFEELEQRTAEAKGRIVFFNAPFTNYGETVRYRSAGASRAAKYGAVACLIRSVGQPGLRTPHTGFVDYDPALPKIPAAALTLEDSQRLQRIHDRGQRIVVRLNMEAGYLPDAESANLVGEIRGSEQPEQVVLLGGHIDSWDVGAGAMDDGGGAIASWDALRVIHRLGLRARRTLRVVLFTNEENGGRGGLAYRDQHLAELPDHVLAIESDGGVFKPSGFGFSGPPAARATVEQIAALLAPIGADHVLSSGGGADISPLVRAANVPAMSPEVEGSRYFIYHHTPADTLERLDPEEVSLNVAAMAVMAYVVADLPARLGR